MADKTINQLDSISSVAGADSVPAWDASEEKTGKITLSQINNFVVDSLDVSSVGGSGKYISAISETNGKISATATSFGSVASGNAYPVTGGAVNTAITNNTAVNYLGVCDTAAETADKIVTCANWNGLAGQSILITFTYANTASNPTLNINGKGALPIYNGSTREEYIPEGNMLLIVNGDCTKLMVIPTQKLVRQYQAVTVTSADQLGYITFTFDKPLPAFNKRTVIITPVLNNDSNWNSYVVTELAYRAEEYKIYAFYRCFLNHQNDLKGFFCTVIY